MNNDFFNLPDDIKNMFIEMFLSENKKLNNSLENIIRIKPELISEVTFDSVILQKIAISRNPLNIQFIKNPNKFIQNYAVKRYNHWLAILKYIQNPCEEIKLFCILKNPDNIKYILDPSEEFQLTAVAKCPREKSYIPSKVSLYFH